METSSGTETNEYAKCINASKRIRWDIDEDVIRGRRLQGSDKFLPDSLSRISGLEFLGQQEQLLLSQIQGRTYANMFGLVERFINCKVMELSAEYQLGDQIALQALLRFSEEELKHQELFRRLEGMADATMPAGYRFIPQPNDVASIVLEQSTWAVLGLTYLIELFTQSHYKKSIDPEANLSPLYKDVFFYHWQEESQHARLDALEWRRQDALLDAAQRERAVDDLITLVGAVDSLLQIQAAEDVAYFLRISGTSFYEENRQRIKDTVLGAYRWQYIISGVEDPHFQGLLQSFINEAQASRIGLALAPLFAAN